MVVNVREPKFDDTVKEQAKECCPDTVFCYSDYYASLVCEILRSRGSRIRV